MTAKVQRKSVPIPDPRLDLSKLAPTKVYELRGHQKPVNRVAFNHDGSFLASAGEDSRVIVWDVSTGDKVRELQRWDVVRGLTFVPNGGNTLASARATPWGPGGCGALTIYNPTIDVTVELYSRAPWSFLALGVHRSGSLIAAGGASRALHVWDLNTVTKTRKDQNRVIPTEYLAFVPPALPSEIHAIDFYPKLNVKPLIAVGCKDGWVKLYQIARPRPEGIQTSGIAIDKQFGDINCVKFSPDGRLLAVAGVDGIIRFHNTITGQIVRTIDTVRSPIHWVSFSPDSQMIADARDDKVVRLWSVETGKELTALRDHTAPVRGVEFSADGKQLASCDGDFLVLTWRLFPPDPTPEMKPGSRMRKK